jgi:hypothetical protein
MVFASGDILWGSNGIMAIHSTMLGYVYLAVKQGPRRKHNSGSYHGGDYDPFLSNSVRMVSACGEPIMG